MAHGKVVAAMTCLMTAADIDVRIAPRVSSAGHPFSEVFYRWLEKGSERFACTRLWYRVDDTPHARAAEAASFIRRQRSW